MLFIRYTGMRDTVIPVHVCCSDLIQFYYSTVHSVHYCGTACGAKQLGVTINCIGKNRFKTTTTILNNNEQSHVRCKISPYIL